MSVILSARYAMRTDTRTRTGVYVNAPSLRQQLAGDDDVMTSVLRHRRRRRRGRDIVSCRRSEM